MSFIQHLLGLLYSSIIILGPVPLGLLLIFVLQDKKREEKPRFSHNLVVLLSCWCIIETSLVLLLGILHLLTFTMVLLIEITILIIGIIFIIRLKRQTPSFCVRDLLKIPKDLSDLKKLIIGILCFISLILLWTSLTCPIKDWDSLAYHLPTMVKWYQTGSISMLDQFYQISRYPYNWEALCTLFIMPSRGDFLVAFPNFISWLLLGLSVYLLGSKIGAKSIYSLAIALLVMTLPIVLLNVNTMHVDLPLASFFMVSLYFIISYNNTRSFFYFTLFLAALGMLLGIKTSGLIYGLLLVIVFTSMMLKSVYFNKRPMNFFFFPHKSMIYSGICGSFSFLLLGGFWYLRNFIEVGNPIGHIKVNVGHFLLFPGTINPEFFYKTTLANVFDPTNPSHWNILLNQMGIRLGIPFFAMIFFSLLLFLAPFTLRKSIKIRTLMGLLALLVITFILYWMTPYSGSSSSHGWKLTPWIGQAIRYAFPFIGVLGIASAAGSTVFRIRYLAITVVVIIASVHSISQFMKIFGIKGDTVLYIGIFLLLIWSVTKVKKNFSVKIPLKLPGLIMLAILIVITVTFRMRENRDTNRRIFYGDIVDYIETSIKQNEIIGYIYSHHVYLLYGKRINNTVLYVPAKEKKLSKWLDLLKKKRIKVIAIGPMGKRWRSRREVLWLKNPNGPFLRVFGKNPEKELTIYRIKTADKDAK